MRTACLQTSYRTLPCLRVQCTATSSQPSEKPAKKFTHSEETKRRISEANSGRKRSPEVNQKVSEAMKGRVVSEETREKISEAKRDTKLTLSHRYNISMAKMGRPQTEEHRAKRGAAISAAKQNKRLNRLGAVAAAAAQQATKDLRPMFGIPVQQYQYNSDGDGTSSSSGEHEQQVGSKNRSRSRGNGASAFGDVIDTNAIITDWETKEKAVIEMVELREKLSTWMNNYEKEYGKKPDMMETSQTAPNVYAYFVRYVALRQLVRRNLVGGETEVTWDEERLLISTASSKSDSSWVWTAFFLQPRVGRVELSTMIAMHISADHCIVDDETTLLVLHEAADNTPDEHKTIYLDFEGVELSRFGKICIGQLMIKGDNKTVYLLDFVEFPDILNFKPGTKDKSLKCIPESSEWKKVLFDPRNDGALWNLHQVLPTNVICLQIADVARNRQSGERRPHVFGLAKVLRFYLPRSVSVHTDEIKNGGKRLFAPDLGGSYEVFSERPMHPSIIEYCCADIQYFALLEEKMFNRLSAKYVEWVKEHNENRVRKALKSLYYSDFKGRHNAIAPSSPSSWAESYYSY